MTDCAERAGSRLATRRVAVTHTNVEGLRQMTGEVWVPEFDFAARHVGKGPGIRARLAQANMGNWRFDFACPDLQIAMEIEGGAWVGGRHTRGAGFERDLEKYDRANRLGWWVYRCSPRMVKNGWAYESLRIMCDMRRGHL